MSKKEALLLASRAFALLLIAWATFEITYLPVHLFELFHYMSRRSVLQQHDYLTSYYLLLTVFNVLRAILLIVAAAAFWNCGPRIEALFSNQQGPREGTAP
jgi:hypothetical protein